MVPFIIRYRIPVPEINMPGEYNEEMSVRVVDVEGKWIPLAKTGDAVVYLLSKTYVKIPEQED